MATASDRYFRSGAQQQRAVSVFKKCRHLVPFRSQTGLPILVLALLCSGPVATLSANQPDWSSTVSRVADSVVSLKLAHLRNFDDTSQGGSSATGFVVDAEKGIVLTNRHVVGSGPLRLSATFQNQERVDAVPLYRDPVHDFAFVRYNPDDLQYLQPASLELRPDKARTGLNIRVIGSDGGEQLSILPGTIARLDREVPSYRRYGYNDFNTFYMQAASGTSGGSSGSPVIDIEGDVVALNAAANTQTASSFFLPLDRIQHALERLRQQQSIDRGSLQTLFVHQPFRNLQRLGLTADLEKEVRSASAGNKGMLIVNQVLPGGVAEGLLESGDILLRIDEQLITDFVSLASLLDASIGEQLSVSVLRHGRVTRVDIDVADLHALAPSKLLELGDSVLQNLSIQHVRAMNRPAQGVVVTRAGYTFTRAGVAEGSVITSIDGEAVDNLQDFISALRSARKSADRLIRYYVPGREFISEQAQFKVSNRWFDHRLCERVDDARFWNCQNLVLAGNAQETPPGDLIVPAFKDPLLNQVAPAMIKVDFSIPFATDNVYARHFKGVGLLIDREQGLVVVDRNTVPVVLGDVELTLFGSRKVPGEVVFLHPRHNFAFVKFDPLLLESTAVEALVLSSEHTIELDELTMVGYRLDGTFRTHQIDDLSPLTINMEDPRLPRFQQTSIDVYGVPDAPPSLGGPLVDDEGIVHAFYMSFAFEENREIRQREWAMPAAVIQQALQLYKNREPYRSLDLRLAYRPLVQAAELGLPDSWLVRYLELPAQFRRTVSVNQVVPGTDAAQKLSTGDILLAIDGQLVTDLFIAERLSQRESCELTILRAGEVMEISLDTTALSGQGTRQLVRWAGANFQEPFPDIGFQKGVQFSGIYIADTQDGSPSLWDGLYRNRFVVEVDGKPVSTLEDFAQMVYGRQQDQVTRITVMSMSGRKRIVAVQPEYNFWPTFRIRHSTDSWKRTTHVN